MLVLSCSDVLQLPWILKETANQRPTLQRHAGGDPGQAIAQTHGGKAREMMAQGCTLETGAVIGTRLPTVEDEEKTICSRILDVVRRTKGEARR